MALREDGTDARNMIKEAPQDSLAFARLYESHFAPLFRYVYYRTGDKDEAEDLVQSVFVKAFHQNKDSAISLPYLFTAARNALIDHWRRKKAISLDASEDLSETLRSDANPEGDAMRQEEIRALRAQMETLTPLEKEVITLRFVSDLSTQEIARMLNKSEVAVRQIQSRAIRSLRKKMN